MPRYSSPTKLLLGCLLFYVAGLCWVTLFPVVSITTGELKPRGLYVDENALLTTSVEREEVLIEQHNYSSATETNPMDNIANSGICSALAHIGMSHFPCRVYTSRPSEVLTTLLVRPKDRPASGEEFTVVVVRLSPSGVTPTWILDLSVALIRHLRHAAWLSKSVVFVFTASSVAPSMMGAQPAVILHPQQQQHNPESAASPRMLRRWLEGFHRRHSEQASRVEDEVDFDYSAFTGVIRDAVVLDLLHLPESEERRAEACSSAGTCEPLMPLLPAEMPASWADGYLLSITGSNGLLPNMDVPAALLSMEPSLLHLHTAGDRRKLEVIATQKSWLLHIFSESSVQLHRYYWGCLAQTMWGLLRGTDGWHGAFLSKNIDSFTLRPLTPTARGGGGHAPRASSSRRAKTTGRPATPGHLLSLLVRYLHTSSNLHEELHHSHALYLLMGPRLFVGLPEYASCLSLLVLPLLLLFLVMYKDTEALLHRPTAAAATATADAAAAAATIVSASIDSSDSPATHIGDENTTDSVTPLVERRPSSVAAAGWADRLAAVGRLEVLVWSGVASVLLDLVWGVLVCAAGCCFLEDHVSRLRGSREAGEGGWGEAVAALVVRVSSLGPMADPSPDSNVAAAVIWFRFSFVCSFVSCATLFLCHWIQHKNFKTSDRLLSAHKKVVSTASEEDGVRLRGYVTAFLLLVTCLLSFVCMHHAVLGFALATALVPVAALFVLAMRRQGARDAAAEPEQLPSSLLVHKVACALCAVLLFAMSAHGLVDSFARRVHGAGVDGQSEAAVGAALQQLLLAYVEEESVVVPYLFILGWMCRGSHLPISSGATCTEKRALDREGSLR